MKKGKPNLKKAKAEADMQDQLKRAQAELANYKKRVDRDKGEFAKFASKEVILDLLPVVDNFERAIEHVPQTEKDNNWLMGITYIHKQLLEMLANHEVVKVEVKAGDEFDSTKHNAVEHKSNDEIKENKIIQVINQAYTMHGEVIRPATVVVSSGKK